MKPERRSKNNDETGNKIEMADLELSKDDLDMVTGGIEVPPPFVPPAPIGEGKLGDEQINCPFFSVRNP